MGQALDRGMVLVMSIWDDYAANMLWLDSNTPKTGSASTPGVARGSCSTSSGMSPVVNKRALHAPYVRLVSNTLFLGVPSDVEQNNKASSVKFSNVKWGALGTTTNGVPAPGMHTTVHHCYTTTTKQTSSAL